MHLNDKCSNNIHNKTEQQTVQELSECELFYVLFQYLNTIVFTEILFKAHISTSIACSR